MASTILLKIAVLDSNTVVPAAEVQDWVSAVSIQMNRDYFQSSVRAQTVVMQYFPKGATIPLDAWWIAVVDNADQANALGYHDITPAGLPLGKVFVKTALTYGEKPSVTLSHEILEMLGDPYVNQLIADGTDVTKFWIKELCDAVEAVNYDITLPATPLKPVRTVAVSDFVLVSYWNTVASKGPFSFKNSLSGPVPSLARGGYMAYTQNGVWNQITNFQTSPTDNPARNLEMLKTRLDSLLDTRKIKRILPKIEWVPSTAKVVG